MQRKHTRNKMENEQNEYMVELENELRQAQMDRRDMAKSQLGMYEQGNQEDNLVKWQLNLEEEKERIFHLLKGHWKGIDDKGNEMWMEPESQDSVILNDYGVDYIMGLLEAFMNRNIILSNFDETRIKEICFDLGDQIVFDIYNDYERMGLNTDDKRKKFPIIVWKVLINVEAALRRAMNNGERQSLRKIMTVNQSENMNNRMPEYNMPQRRGSRWNPTNWGR